VLEDDDEEPFAVIVAPVRVQQLAEEYVSAKHYRMPLKEFRKITSKSGNSLRNKVQELLEIIPDDAQPPLSQMREKFCSKSAEGTGGEDPEELWDKAYSASSVKRGLSCWISLLDELNDDAGGSSTGPDPITAEIEFVRGLAHYWKHELRNNPSRWGEDPHGETPNQSAGPFPVFVREAAKIIPSDYSPKSWDWAIRPAVCTENLKPERNDDEPRQGSGVM
jgi:hypothetical protein